MSLTRRRFLEAALLLPGGAYLTKFRVVAEPRKQMVKITAIKAMQLDNVGDTGCLIRIETDAGLVGYGEAKVSSSTARSRIEQLQTVLVGQDPLAIERCFYMMTAEQHAFTAHIPTISGIDIALWDLAGKILDLPLYRLLGGPMREAAPIYWTGRSFNMLDAGECRAWFQKVREAPEGFTAFKFDVTSAGGVGNQYPFTPTLPASDLKKVARAFANVRTAAGDDLEIALHCHSQFDTPSAIGLCKAIEPVDPSWVEDPLSVNYSGAWLELKRSTRVPILTGEDVELVSGFRSFLDNGAVDIVHPDISLSGGITGCKKIADYAALTRTPMALHCAGGSLIRFYASVHLSGAVQNFFKIENDLGEAFGFTERMAADKQPMIRKGMVQFPEGPGLGLEINEDWLRRHMAKGETWWG
jgi:L-alanine-DL-glutamate epimerase-like enolase superfamily enzyme